MYAIINFFDPWYYGSLDPARVPNTVKYAIRWPLRIFLLSFTLGSMLFAGYQLLKSETLLVIGFFYVMAAVAFNLLTLIVFLVMCLQYNQFSVLILKKTAILLLNIPIAIIYFVLIFEI